MKKSIISLATAALLAAPVVAFANDTVVSKWVDTDTAMVNTDANGPGARGADVYVENIEANEIPTNVVVGYETKLVNGVEVTTPVYLERVEGSVTETTTAAGETTTTTAATTKAADKKSDAKTSTSGTKTLPKTSAAK